MGIFKKLRRTTRPEPRVDRAQPLPSLTTTWDEAGASITFPDELWEALSKGMAPAQAREQRIALEMMVEAGLASRVDNRCHLPIDSVGRLSDDDAQSLGLPPFYPYSFDTTITGNTTSPRFRVELEAVLPTHREHVRRTGAVITVGRGDHANDYRLSAPMVDALAAIELHEQSPRTEPDNVRLVAALQRAQATARHFVPLMNETEDELTENQTSVQAPGFPLDLKHLDKFTTHVPDRIRVTVEDREDGSLLLTPDLGTGHNPETLNSRWSQLSSVHPDESGVLRVDNHLITVSPSLVEDIRTVHRKQTIPAEQAAQFKSAPGDFLGGRIDTDSFSMRVKAIGVVEPVAFTVSSSSSAQWFATAEEALEPEELPHLIETHKQLAEYEDLIERTWEHGGTVIPHDETHVIDVSDHVRVQEALEKSRRRLDAVSPGAQATGAAVSVGFLLEQDQASADEISKTIGAAERPTVDYSQLAYEPYPHQREGIEWLAARMRLSLDGAFDSPDRVQGALLADDMGLGKTFMTLVALRQFSHDIAERGQGPQNPHLLVVPLTLVENWQSEMKKSFKEPPFNDVVVLHGAGLKRYRFEGAQRETRVSASRVQDNQTVDVADLRQSLIVGEQYGRDRLDQPGRLIITTYETLASYQLSLGQVDWGAVVFDEAQDIKNPDALRTRAAKGLKARFKLVATGTPVENSLRDFWCLLDTAQPNMLGPWLAFKQQWVKPMESADPAEHNALGRRLADFTRPVMLRRNKEDNLPELPSKTIYTGSSTVTSQEQGVVFNDGLRTIMPQRQAQTYSAILSGHSARAGAAGAALKTLNALRAVSLHPDAQRHSIAPQATWQDAARLLGMMSVLDGIQQRDEKAILFVINKTVQRRLALWLEERYGLYVHIINGDTKATGQGASDNRSGLIKDFEHRRGFNLIIMSPLAAGRGLTVTEANHAIHLERHWNPAKEAQATDRVHRIGQKRPVHVYLPTAVHPDPAVKSFDENLHDLLAQKMALKDAVVVPKTVDESEMMGAMGLR